MAEYWPDSYRERSRACRSHKICPGLQPNLSPDQNGSINLNWSGETGKYPYIDFYNQGWGQDFNARIINSGNNQLDFATNSGGTVLSVKDNMVGIGTSNPSSLYKLSVAGGIRAQSIKVESGWSDFVFKPDYKLLSLEELDSYIKTNGHLPDIPSENEVKESGVDLGDMTSKLLQKIEDLTLYVISQNSEIQQLKKDNNNLKDGLLRLSERGNEK